jgi:hypothetical protein
LAELQSWFRAAGLEDLQHKKILKAGSTILSGARLAKPQ